MSAQTAPTPRERLYETIETLERCAGTLMGIKGGYPEAALDLGDLAERLEDIVDALGAIYGAAPEEDAP
jgi:hypothetical protein